VPRFRRGFALLAALLLLLPASARAQGRDGFVEATVQLLQAAAGEFGDEGRYLTAAVDAMARALQDWDAAIARAEAGLAADAVKAAPTEAARMRAGLAAIFVERGRFAAALQELEQSTRLDPALAEAHLLKGLVLERLGRAADARAAYRAAWQRRPLSLVPAYYVALAPPSSSDADRASAAAATTELLAAAADASGQRRPLVFPTDAFLDDTASMGPVLPLARYAPAFGLIATGRYDEAVAAFRVAAAVDPLVTDAPSDLLAAARALRAGDAAGAIEQLTPVVAARPDAAQAHRVLGLAYQAAGKGEQALAELEMTIRLDRTDERARIALSAVLARAGRTQDARLALRDALVQIPTSGQAQWRLGQLALAAGDLAEAIPAFEQAAAAGPLAGAGTLLVTLGRSYNQLPDLDGAARAYRSRVAVLPHDRTAHLELSAVYRSAGQVNDALVEALAAAVLDPASADARAAAGQLLVAAGRDAEAVPLLERAVALDARHRESRYALSRALTRLGRADAAAEQLRAYEELQAGAMAAERQRFEDNAQTIERLLDAPAGTSGR
jgi:tetratricopeptide (TPR) repeat protein